MTHLASLLKGIADATDAENKESASIKTFKEFTQGFSLTCMGEELDNLRPAKTRFC